ncbi:MAG: phosphotransferase [Bacteroidota bacterium]|nr:phosphotransferase [Bacteroidota bacterium]
MDDFKDIKADASDKKIYRLFVDGTSFIGVYNENKKENLAFINFTKTFSDLNLNVPMILKISDDYLSYLEEDLGDISLFKLTSDSESHISMNYYKQALSDLIKFQIAGKDHIDYNFCYQAKEFNSEVIRDDFNKFNTFYVRYFMKQNLSEEVLRLIDISCKVISNVDSEYFLYRDFQPRNILFHDNKFYYIDYQTGRKGPLQYDLASFLYSGSIQLSKDERSNLVGHYLSDLRSYIPVNEEEFRHYFYYLSFLRLVQVLGSYAYQFKRKNDKEILKKIPKAIENMKSLKNKIEDAEVRDFITMLTESHL